MQTFKKMTGLFIILILTVGLMSLCSRDEVKSPTQSQSESLSLNKNSPPPPGEKIDFVEYDKAPAPVGGFKSIQNHLTYPESARKEKIEGKVILMVQISEHGEVTGIRVKESVGHGLDEAAAAAIKKTQWEPAIHNEKPVSVWVMIPVQFRLS